MTFKEVYNKYKNNSMVKMFYHDKTYNAEFFGNVTDSLAEELFQLEFIHDVKPLFIEDPDTKTFLFDKNLNVIPINNEYLIDGYVTVSKYYIFISFHNKQVGAFFHNGTCLKMFDKNVIDNLSSIGSDNELYFYFKPNTGENMYICDNNGIVIPIGIRYSYITLRLDEQKLLYKKISPLLKKLNKEPNGIKYLLRKLFEY